MTAQINDTVFHRKIRFSLAGISGRGLVEPTTFGFEPVAMSTACWRGYVANYTVEDDQLFLTSLEVGLPTKEALLAKAGRGPVLFGTSAQPGKWFGFLYEGFKQPVPFTGGLLLAEGFIRDLYVHMGFHPAWKYERVREVLCEEGHVLEDHDRCKEMAEVRRKAVENMGGTKERDRQRTREEISTWVAGCFSREY